MNNYYVYVYIDPRNFEEFYFGKGKGSRKDSHLFDSLDSEKTRRIGAIKKAGLTPIIRVIARDLSEHDALLVEKTLLWKLGRQLTNSSTGHYSENFRPHDCLHRELPGFDFHRGIYYYNIGEDEYRNWDDYRDYGFIAAGQGQKWREVMLGFREGDVVAAYLKKYGYVGIGRIYETAKPIRDVKINGKPLLTYRLRATRSSENSESDDLSEYVVLVDWIKSVERNEAKWKAKAGIYTTTHVRASLDGQPKTIAFLDHEFGINLYNLIE
jgi:uncharacterized protein